MPRKKRDIRRDLCHLGFEEEQGKGDHTVFRHPLVPFNIAVDGKDGADAKPYDESNLRRGRRMLEDVRRRQQP